MGYQVLSLKYRPQRFDELWAQDHIRDTLRNAVAQGRVANAYLFCGPRGVGKTTTARILAKSLNCVEGPTVDPCGGCSPCREIAGARSLDVQEIDGASNRGIDEIREIREHIKYAPASARYKIYIIDEVHMLTPEAFNALLKTLEEPPTHARFIFATTAPFKVPPTILSRCQRFDFRRVPSSKIAERLRWIAEQEGIEITPDALALVAELADGSLRDGESILDQLTAYSLGPVTRRTIEELLGLPPTRLFFEYVDRLRDKGGVIRLLNQVFDQGYDLVEFYSGLVLHFRRLILAHHGLAQEIFGVSGEERERLIEQARGFTAEALEKGLEYLYQQEYGMRHSLLPRPLLELTSLRLSELCGEVRGGLDPEQLWHRAIEEIEAERPSLSAVMGMARPDRLEGEVLWVKAPAGQGMNYGLLNDGRSRIEASLTRLLGRRVRLEVELEQGSSPPEPAVEMLKSIFEVEEVE